MSHCAIIGITIGALALAGCALKAPEMAAPPIGMSDGASFGELPTQNLAKGQCALVLWSLKSPPQRFLMTLNEPAVARMQVQGRVVELARISQSGDPVYGQYPDQHYRGDKLSVGITFSTTGMSTLSSGAVVSATVEYADVQGWSAIIPAAGLIACQA